MNTTLRILNKSAILELRLQGYRNKHIYLILGCSSKRFYKAVGKNNLKIRYIVPETNFTLSEQQIKRKQILDIILSAPIIDTGLPYFFRARQNLYSAYEIVFSSK